MTSLSDLTDNFRQMVWGPGGKSNMTARPRSLLRRARARVASGELADAERLLRQLVARLRMPSARTRPVVLVSALRELGTCLQQRGRYREAERLLREAVSLAESAPIRKGLGLAGVLNDLAVCYKYLARFIDAGPLYQRALVLTEQALGPDHPDVATVYHNLGGLEHAAGNWSRGEPFARRAVRIRARALGPRHPLVAADLTALAALLDRQGKFAEAERLYGRALRILEREHGPRHHLVAVTLNNLAAVHHARGRTDRAEALYRRALDIDSEALGPRHPKVAFALNNLAVLTGVERPHEAAVLFRRALAIFRASLGPRHPNVGVSLENFAPVLRRLGRRHDALAAARLAARILGAVEAVNDDGVALTGTINPDRARFRLLVRPSPIHRLGVFAEDAIPGGRMVIEYTGEHISRREAARRWDPNRSYLFGLDRGRVVDGAIGGSGAEYVNHSCAPNLRARVVRGRIVYFSLRTIERGEELTLDYKYQHDTDRMPCACGAATCRGTMNLEPPRRVGAGRRGGSKRLTWG
jgi:tetratricopeptide (TPR) repeat protein